MLPALPRYFAQDTVRLKYHQDCQQLTYRCALALQAKQHIEQRTVVLAAAQVRAGATAGTEEFIEVRKMPMSAAEYECVWPSA